MHFYSSVPRLRPSQPLHRNPENVDSTEWCSDYSFWF